jgi:hypothetical protein
MTQDELPALPEQTLLCRFMPGDYRYGDVHGFTADQMRAYATAAVLAERERCARIADGVARQYAESAGGHSAERAAAAIRMPPAVKEG